MNARRPVIVENLIWRETDDGIVVVDPVSGKVRVLNGVGSLVWKLIDDQQSVEAIERQMAERYNLEPQQAAGDLNAFLEQLDARGLILWRQ